MRKHSIWTLLLAAGLLAGCAGAPAKSTAVSQTEQVQEQTGDSTADDPNEETQTETEEENLRPAPSRNGALHVENGHLVDENGEQIQLKGISSHGLAWYPQYVNEALFQEFAEDWNVSVMRLALYPAESGGWCTDGNRQELLETLRTGVEAARTADQYVIADWHVLSEQDPNTYLDEAKEFFDLVSKEYADDPGILYEICNEPNGSAGWKEIKAYAQEIIPVIRANDPDALILVGTPSWSQDVDAAAADPLDDDNILYTMHFYAASHKEDLRNRLESVLKQNAPVFVSEFSICEASGDGTVDLEQARAWIDLLDEYGISYVAWGLSDKEETCSLFVSGLNQTSGFAQEDLTPVGQWIRELFRDGLPAGQASQEEPADCSLKEITGWEEDGMQYVQFSLTITNRTEADAGGWKVEIPFSGNISLSDSWNGVFVLEGESLVIENESWNGALASGASVNDIGWIVCGSSRPEAGTPKLIIYN